MSTEFNPIGVIEGFYGTTWSPVERLKFPTYLNELGLNTYLYCPKSDPFLRKRWRESWPQDKRMELRRLSSECKAMAINLGVGISPFELYKRYSRDEKRKLRKKIFDIMSLDPKFLCVLFDDMRGDSVDSAIFQTEIANDVLEWSQLDQILLCPTYYSSDPILEQVFGEKPQNYEEILAGQLDRRVGIMWTGTQVCSSEITSDHIVSVNNDFDRQITLWDNYAANDGRKRSEYLFLKSLSGRGKGILSLIDGHLCNGMVQSELSLITLSGLAELHGTAQDTKLWLEEKLGKLFMEFIMRDRNDFENFGRRLSSFRLLQLIKEYDNEQSLASEQVSKWLKGDYKFDPNCLTD